MNEFSGNRRDQFLSELAALSNKHRIAVTGCGCCGSPYLSDIAPSEIPGRYDHDDGDDLRWERRGDTIDGEIVPPMIGHVEGEK